MIGTWTHDTHRQIKNLTQYICSLVSKCIICACVHVQLLQSYPTLCDSREYSPPGSSVHGILQADNWTGLPCPPPGHLPHPETEPMSPAAPALQVVSLLTGSPGKANFCLLLIKCSYTFFLRELLDVAIKHSFKSSIQ